jgi:magnesium-transporting ATPase (P-type)
MLRIANNSEIPADMVLLTTSASTGTAYVETSNIDGETNLKIRNSARTAKQGPMWSEPSQLKRYSYQLRTERSFYNVIFLCTLL